MMVVILVYGLWMLQFSEEENTCPDALANVGGHVHCFLLTKPRYFVHSCLSALFHSPCFFFLFNKSRVIK